MTAHRRPSCNEEPHEEQSRHRRRNGAGGELVLGEHEHRRRHAAAEHAGEPVGPGITSSGTNLARSPSTDNVAASGYDILRAPGASGGTFSQVGTSSGTSFAGTGPSPSTTYRYQVRARDAAGNLSGVSNTVTVTTAPGTGGGGCSAALVVQNQWNGGYVAQPVTVTNTGGSTLFALPAGHSIVGSWNAALTTSGQTVTARNLGYNGTVAPGQRVEFGFQASRPSGNTATPTSLSYMGS
jgi:chitodextrinase